FGLGGGAESVGTHGKLLGHIAIAQDLDAVALAIGQADAAQRRKIHARAIFKNIQRFHIHGNVDSAMPRIVETAFGNSADEGHLAAFKADANGTAGAGRLALATASRGLAVAAGFTLAEPFATVLGARTRF